MYSIAGNDNPFIPRKAGDFKHHPDEGEDKHILADRQRLNDKVGGKMWDNEHKKILDSVRKQLNISKDEHDEIRQAVQEDKDKVREQKEIEEKQRLEEEKQKLLQVDQHHSVGGVQGGEPSDSDVREKREKVKEVSKI